jgi:hypothetical protein
MPARLSLLHPHRVYSVTTLTLWGSPQLYKTTLTLVLIQHLPTYTHANPVHNTPYYILYSRFISSSKHLSPLKRSPMRIGLRDSCQKHMHVSTYVERFQLAILMFLVFTIRNLSTLKIWTSRWLSSWHQPWKLSRKDPESTAKYKLVLKTQEKNSPSIGDPPDRSGT